MNRLAMLKIISPPLLSIFGIVNSFSKQNFLNFQNLRYIIATDSISLISTGKAGDNPAATDGPVENNVAAVPAAPITVEGEDIPAADGEEKEEPTEEA